MISARRISAFVAHKIVEAYDARHAALSAILDARFPWKYQQLAQDALSINGDLDTKTRRQRSCLWKLLACIAGFLCVLAAFAVYARGNGIRSTTSAADLSRTKISRDEFIAAILREPIEGLLDPDPIRKKCDETTFQEGLVWHCAAIVGGIGNVANMWLNCARYAIEAGATTLILPRLGRRSDNLIGLGGEDQSVELSSLFDVSYFLDSWKLACPQIRAVVSESEVLNLPSSGDSPRLSPNSVKNFQMRKYLIVDPTGWREAFDTWLAKNSALDTMSVEKPVRVWQNLVLAQWNRETHPQEFVNSFPRLFRYPVQTRRLAASSLWSLEKKLGRPVVADAIVLSSGPSPSSGVNSLGSHRLALNGFLGAHIRVAADAAAAGWPGYESQAPFYLAEAKQLNLTTIYLATGSPEHRKQFRADAEREGLSVIVKEDLLDGEELEELQKLTWDQQALVDFDVLMHSTSFYGFVRSSFSWSLALRRGILPEAGTEISTKTIDEYRDSLSAIVGRKDDINPEGMWP